MKKKIGLMGTITYDKISHESGALWRGLGGVLYQGAVLCALGKEVYLYTNLGLELAPEVEKIINNWSSLRKKGIKHVEGPGNQVELHYPQMGERVEILRSVVPPLEPDPIIDDLPQFEMLIAVLNSGFDIELKGWQKIVSSASCPIWLDIHSLPLSKEINMPRKYLPLHNWQEWIEGVTFIQANAKEMASVVGHPERSPSKEEISAFAALFFDLGTKGLFITLGQEGVLVLSPEGAEKISPVKVNQIVDTTGCGDVFCAGTAVELVKAKKPFEAAALGLKLASKAAITKGVEEIYDLVKC